MVKRIRKRAVDFQNGREINRNLPGQHGDGFCFRCGKEHIFAPVAFIHEILKGLLV
jgi:hypothetical protein